jgi:hypothetical protein
MSSSVSEDNKQSNWRSGALRLPPGPGFELFADVEVDAAPSVLTVVVFEDVEASAAAAVEAAAVDDDVEASVS